VTDFFNIFISFIYLFFFPYFFRGGGLGYIFGCDLISYHCATSREVAGSIPDGVIGIFH